MEIQQKTNTRILLARNLEFSGDDITLMTESEVELKSLLMRVKEKSKKAGENSTLKTKIMASGLITSWQIEGEKVETVTKFYFPESQNHSRR